MWPKIKYKSLKFILTYLFMTILIWMNYLFLPYYLKAVTTLLIMVFTARFLFKISLKKAFLTALILQVISIISEIIFSIIISLMSNLNADDVANLFQGSILANSLISVNIFILSILIHPNKYYNKILKFTTHISIRKIILFFCFIIWCFNLIFYFSFYNDNNYITTIFNIVLGIIYCFIVLSLMKKDNKYNKMYAKYTKSLENLEEYENIINEYRVINHENKNQLLCIKGMTRNKKVHDYLDEILRGKTNHSEFLIEQALLIPIGGLRGLIYSKLIVIKNKKLNYKLNIDRKLNNKLFSKMTSKDLLDICQIIGVYIDNAIEGSENLKDPFILINLYLDNNVYFEVINNIEGIIDLSKIDNKGYTTKAGNHGYGLTLVKKALERKF